MYYIINHRAYFSIDVSHGCDFFSSLDVEVSVTSVGPQRCNAYTDGASKLGKHAGSPDYKPYQAPRAKQLPSRVTDSPVNLGLQVQSTSTFKQNCAMATGHQRLDFETTLAMLEMQLAQNPVTHLDRMFGPVQAEGSPEQLRE